MFRPADPSIPPSPTQPILAPPIESGLTAPIPMVAKQPLSKGRINSRRFAYAFIPLSAVTGWFFIWRPLAEATHTGRIFYYLKMIMLPPILLYLGIVGWFTDISDSEIRRPDGKGGRRLTTKGWKITTGAILIVILSMAAWFLLLHHLGIEETSQAGA